MLYVDIPSRDDIRRLNQIRSDACVSIYLATTPKTDQITTARITLKNDIKEAGSQLDAIGLDKGRRVVLFEKLEGLAEDDDFWSHQANSLAVLATADMIRTFRLPNALTPVTEISDRFHVTPLLRAVTFPYSAYVLALSQNAVRLIELHSDLPPTHVPVHGLPRDAASVVGTASLNSRPASGRIQGDEGNVRLRQFARKVDAALRPVLTGRETPLILAAPDRLQSVYRSVNSYAGLVDEHLVISPGDVSDEDLAEKARSVLDSVYKKEVADLNALYSRRVGEGLATSDLADAARAATFGAIEAISVNIDSVVPGSVDERTGAIRFAESVGGKSYRIVDEIAGRALSTGARVLGVRKHDLPDGSTDLAAILRYQI